jgi:hypothetical protein
MIRYTVQGIRNHVSITVQQAKGSFKEWVPTTVMMTIQVPKKLSGPFFLGLVHFLLRDCPEREVATSKRLAQVEPMQQIRRQDY